MDSTKAARGPAREPDPIELPERLVGKLRGANRHLIGWLARDASNRSLFLEHPIAALVEAGVELTDREKRALILAHESRRGASRRRYERPRL